MVFADNLLLFEETYIHQMMLIKMYGSIWSCFRTKGEFLKIKYIFLTNVDDAKRLRYLLYCWDIRN